MAKTKIEWADRVWNPVTGCTKVSEGCRYCYADRYWHRFHQDVKFSQVQMRPEKLEEPLHWKKPARIFVDSMGDLFHEDVSIEFIEKIFAICRIAEEHTFIILTKRPKRMYELLNSFSFWVLVSSWVAVYAENGPHVKTIPNNVWLGVSVEDQKTADERIPILLKTPAAVRFVNVEPMLGPINLDGEKSDDLHALGCGDKYCTCGDRGIDWVICGCESGPKSRPMSMLWPRSLRDQCQDAGVPFFFKQSMFGGKLVKMPELDGKIWDEIPEIRS